MRCALSISTCGIRVQRISETGHDQLHEREDWISIYTAAFSTSTPENGIQNNNDACVGPGEQCP